MFTQRIEVPIDSNQSNQQQKEMLLFTVVHWLMSHLCPFLTSAPTSCFLPPGLAIVPPLSVPSPSWRLSCLQTLRCQLWSLQIPVFGSDACKQSCQKLHVDLLQYTFLLLVTASILLLSKVRGLRIIIFFCSQVDNENYLLCFLVCLIFFCILYIFKKKLLEYSVFCNFLGFFWYLVRILRVI